MMVLQKLVKVYQMEKRNVKIPVLLGISATFQRKDLTFILGSSGAGKSTLFSIIAGDVRQDAGEISIDGENYYFKKTKIVFLRQNPLLNVFPNVDIKENFRIVASLNGIKLLEKNVKAILKRFNVNIPLSRKVGELSSGQIQRLGIALALLRTPDLLLMDEPTAHLDRNNASQVIEILEEYCRKNNSYVLIATHDQDLAKAHTQFLLHDGVFAHYDLQELIHQYRLSRSYVQKEEDDNVIGIIEVRCEVRDGVLLLPEKYIHLLDTTHYREKRTSKYIELTADPEGDITPSFDRGFAQITIEEDIQSAAVRIDLGRKQLIVEAMK